MLQRAIDETNEEIMFLAYAVTNDEITELHQRFLKEFWQEEVDESGKLLGAEQKRGMISRKKIQAYLSRIEATDFNPHRDLSVVIDFTDTMLAKATANYPGIVFSKGSGDDDVSAETRRPSANWLTRLGEITGKGVVLT